MFLANLHVWFGYFAVIAAVVALVGIAAGNRPALRIAPVILDISLLLGLLTLLFSGARVAWIHPPLMLAAVIIGHVVSRRPARTALTGWVVIVVLLAIGVLFARGTLRI